jgi:hypothetical protein
MLFIYTSYLEKIFLLSWIIQKSCHHIKNTSITNQKGHVQYVKELSSYLRSQFSGYIFSCLQTWQMFPIWIGGCDQICFCKIEYTSQSQGSAQACWGAYIFSTKWLHGSPPAKSSKSCNLAEVTSEFYEESHGSCYKKHWYTLQSSTPFAVILMKHIQFWIGDLLWQNLMKNPLNLTATWRYECCDQILYFSKVSVNSCHKITHLLW